MPGIAFAMRGTMLKFSEKVRTLLAEMLFDFANIGAGALIFGQALGGVGYSAALAALGLVVWVGLVALGVILVERGSR